MPPAVDPGTCEVPGCGKAAYRRGLCGMHRSRLMRNGSLELGGRREVPVPDLAARTADLRLAIEQAHTRVTQAVIVLEYPHVAAAKGVTAAQLLDEALDALDGVRGAPITPPQ